MVALLQTERPPTLTCFSTTNDVAAWLFWFGKRTNLSEDKIEKLQEAFLADGECLLGLSKEECINISEKEGFKTIIGTNLYGKLHAGTALRSSLVIYLSIYL